MFGRSIVTEAVRVEQVEPGLRRRRPLAGVQNTFSSLSNRNFLLLFVGMLFFMAATHMQMLAQSYLVYDITGSGTILGIVNFGIAVPMLTVPLFGGAIADRMERKTIILLSQSVAVVLAIVIGTMIYADVIGWPHLMIATMIQGGFWAFLMPARQAIIPQLVGPDKITNALALNAAGMGAMTMIAPALAGWLYAQFGPSNVYYVTAALSLAAVVLTVFFPKTGVGSQKKGATMLSDIAEGISYVRQRKVLLVLLVVALLTTMLAMPSARPARR